MSWPRLYAIVDAAVALAAGYDPPALARAYLEGGARLIQLRAPGVGSSRLLAWSRAIVADAAACGGRLIVNDRGDVALLADAGGVHLGQDDLPVEAVRALLGPERIIGLSTHDAAQLADALARPVDYVAIGPVFETTTKTTGYAAVGLQAVGETRARAGARPVVAIGGITLDRAPGVIAAGASSVAVISDLLADGDPADRVRRYVDMLEDA